MISNYLRVAVRILLRFKVYSVINVAGLAIGLACSILILLYVEDEMSYDRFHEKAHQIYRVGEIGNLGDRQFKEATAPAPLADALLDEFPEVLQATRIIKGINTVIRYEDKSFFETSYIYSDSTFFDVFSFSLVSGNPETALTEPFSMVISESASARYFGKEDPMGKVLHEADGNDFVITGVVKDNPANSHFHFDFLVSMNSLWESKSENWLSDGYYTYIVLQEDFPPAKLAKKLPGFTRKKMGPQILKYFGISIDEWSSSENDFNFYIELLTRIYLFSDASNQLEPTSEVRYIYFFITIAFLILILAAINFTSLTTAKSSIRAREVGIRKVMGSSRNRIIYQLLAESVFLSMLALIIALAAVELFLPTFNQIAYKDLSMNLFARWYVPPILIIGTLAAGVLTGFYSAISISTYNILAVLRGKLGPGNKRGWFRSGLVVFQFTIAIIIVAFTIVIYAQLTFIQNKNLGFDKEHVLVVDRAYGLEKQTEAFKYELLKHPGISNVTLTSTIPGKNGWGGAIFQKKDSPPEQLFHFSYLAGDLDFTKTFGIEMAEGRFFSDKYGADSMSIVLNETAVRSLGFKYPVGQNLMSIASSRDERVPFKIIGVVKDFHYAPMHEKIGNIAILYRKRYFPRYVSLRIDNQKMEEIIKYVEKTWKKLSMNQPFRYFFMDESFDDLYKSERRTGKIFTFFSILAIFIASLGLTGLSSFMAEQRVKEIGIRKVNGATIVNILSLLSVELTKWILIANILAWPVGWLLMKNWLQNFAYKTNLSWWIFVISGVTSLIIALLTISRHAIKLGLANPANSLRYE